MTPEQEEILLKAIQTFGFENQLCKLMEECGELIQAANKYRSESNKNNELQFLSEISDVEVLIAQFKADLSAENLIQRIKADKIKRLKKIIEKAA